MKELAIYYCSSNSEATKEASEMMEFLREKGVFCRVLGFTWDSCNRCTNFICLFPYGSLY